MPKLKFLSNKQYNKLILLSYTTGEIVSFTKVLGYFIAYWYEETMTPQIQTKYKGWLKEAQPLIKEAGIGTEFNKLVSAVAAKPSVLPANKVNWFGGLLMEFRDSIYKDKNKKTKILERSAIPNNIKTLLVQMFSLFRGRSQSAYPNIERNISILKEPLLNAYFIDEVETDSRKIKELVSNYLSEVKNITGKNVEALDLEQIKKLNSKPASVVQHFNQLEKSVTTLIKTTILNAVRSSGEHYLPASDLIELLKSKGLPTFYIPKGFVGMYDDKLNMYLNDGRQIPKQIGGWMEMTKNPKPGKYVAKGKGLRVSDIKTYQVLDDSKKSSKERFNKVREFIPVMPLYVKRWRDLFLSSSGDEKMKAAMVELLFITAGRIGSVSKASSDDPTYGISVLQARHVKDTRNGGLKITYIGKKGVEITHILNPTSETSKELIAYIKKLRANCHSPRGFIFTGTDGQPIGDNNLRKYLKDPIKLPEGLTPHKFRHARGTDLLLKYMEANKAALQKAEKNKTELTSMLKDMLTEVGKKLGHARTTKDGETIPTWQQAAKSYVDPLVMRELFTKNDYTVPSFIPDHSTTDSED